jgi:hypothetical protein
MCRAGFERLVRLGDGDRREYYSDRAVAGRLPYREDRAVGVEQGDDRGAVQHVGKAHATLRASSAP